MTYSSTQWAAVRILVGEIKDPPQMTVGAASFLRPTYNFKIITKSFYLLYNNGLSLYRLRIYKKRIYLCQMYYSP